MTSMRPIGAPLPRACALAATLLLVAGSAHAAVRDAGHGIAIDRTVAAQRRGAETLHAVRIDRRAFLANSLKGGALDLPSAGAAAMTARFERAEQRGNDWTWVGRVDTAVGEQKVVLTFGPDAVFGTIPQFRGPPLRIESRAGRRPVLVEGEARVAATPHAAPLAKTVSGTGSGRVTPAVVVDPPKARPYVEAYAIDTVVAYTPEVKTRYGSVAAIETRMAYLEQLTNQALYDSHAHARVRVVSVKAFDYTAQTTNQDLLELVHKTDRLPSPERVQLEQWRWDAEADAVVVVRSIDALAQYPECGATRTTHFGEPAHGHAYAVIMDGAGGCMDETFAHHMGHLLGSEHDFVTSGGAYGFTTASRGHRSAINGEYGFSTLLATPHAGDVRLNRYSNAYQFDCPGNQACGNVTDADAAPNFWMPAWTISRFGGEQRMPGVTNLELLPGTVVEGNNGTRELLFRAQLNSPSSNPVQFRVHTGDVEHGATAGRDYVALVDTWVTIPAGASYVDIPVTVLGDAVSEYDERFILYADTVSGAQFSYSILFGTITDDDPPRLSISDAWVEEGNSGTKLMIFTVSLSRASDAPVDFTIAPITTATTTASAGSDFVATTPVQRSIPAGALSRPFAVTINGDTTGEANEVFVVSITHVAGATLADGAGLGRIYNDDLPGLSVSNASVVEGHSGTRQAVFTLSLSQPTNVPVSYYYSTSLPVGATASADDFQGASAVAGSIAAGQLAKTVAIPVVGDTAPEIDEVFLLMVGGVGNATIVDGAGAGTILNDDTPVMTIADVTLVEGDSGNAIATFTVRLNGPAAKAVTFDIATYDTAAATAKPGTDYVAKAQAGRIIPVGGTSAMFNVGLIGDTAVEGNEVFVVVLSNVVNATLGDGAAKATIVNDD